MLVPNHSPRSSSPASSVYSSTPSASESSDSLDNGHAGAYLYSFGDHPAIAQTPRASTAGLGLQAPPAYQLLCPTTFTAMPPAVQVPKAPSNLPYGRALCRADFTQIQTVRFFGDAFGRMHQPNQSDAHGHTPLYLVRDVAGRLASVAADPKRRAASKLDFDSVEALVNVLSQDLTSAAAHRVYADFNCYPASLRIDGASYTNTPDHKQTGWHADFEVLNRLVYTARMDSTGLEALLDAYYAARDHASVTSDQREAAYKAKYLFDILYYLYFIDCAFDTAHLKMPFAMGQQTCLKQAALLRSRLEDDAQTSVGATLPTLRFMST